MPTKAKPNHFTSRATIYSLCVMGLPRSIGLSDNKQSGFDAIMYTKNLF